MIVSDLLVEFVVLTVVFAITLLVIFAVVFAVVFVVFDVVFVELAMLGLGVSWTKLMLSNMTPKYKPGRKYPKL